MTKDEKERIVAHSLKFKQSIAKLIEDTAAEMVELGMTPGKGSALFGVCEGLIGVAKDYAERVDLTPTDVRHINGVRQAMAEQANRQARIRNDPSIN
jgi:hypothetical protein